MEPFYAMIHLQTICCQFPRISHYYPHQVLPAGMTGKQLTACRISTKE